MAEIVIKLVNGELAGKTMQEINKSVRDSAKELSKAKIGTEEWVKAHQKLDDAKKTQADLKKQIEGTASASDMLKQAWNNLPGAQFFNQFAQSFGMMKTGVGGLITQFGVLRTAIVATGIGALVVLLGSLVVWFTKTEEGADKLKSVMYPIKALFQALIGILSELGGKVFKRLAEAFNDPIQAIKDLGNAILENVINRFKAFAVLGDGLVKIFNGEWEDGLKSLTDGYIQLGTGITEATDKMKAAYQEGKKLLNEATDAGARLLELENKIEDAEVALTVTRAKLNVEAAKAMEIARNTLKGDEERLEAAKRFQQITDEQTKQEMDFLKLKQQMLLLEQESDRILTDDERLERAKMEADIIQLQADNIDKKKKARALELNIIEEIAKRESDIAKNIAQLKAQAAKDGFDQEVAQVQQQTEEKILALQGSEAQILEQKMLLKEIEEQQLLAIAEKYQAINNENAKKAADDQAKIDKKAADDAIAAKEREAAGKQAVEEAYNEFASGSFDLLIGLLGEDEKARKKNASAIKAFSIGKILVDLQQEIAGYMANPASTASFGVAGGIKSALAVLRAGVAIASVTKQKFSLGGLVQGPSHEQGGIPGVIKPTGTPIEFEGGEFFFSKKATAALGVGMLSRINDRFTNSFANGGPVNPFPTSAGSGGSQFDTSRMEKMMMGAIDAINARIDRIKVQNVVTETRDQIKVVNDIQADADV